MVHAAEYDMLIVPIMSMNMKKTLIAHPTIIGKQYDTLVYYCIVLIHSRRSDNTDVHVDLSLVL